MKTICTLLAFCSTINSKYTTYDLRIKTLFRLTKRKFTTGLIAKLLKEGIFIFLITLPYLHLIRVVVVLALCAELSHQTTGTPVTQHWHYFSFRSCVTTGEARVMRMSAEYLHTVPLEVLHYRPHELGQRVKRHAVHPRQHRVLGHLVSVTPSANSDVSTTCYGVSTPRLLSLLEDRQETQLIQLTPSQDQILQPR